MPDETSVVTGQDIFLDVTNKLVDMLEQGFQPRYVILWVAGIMRGWWWRPGACR